MAGTPIINAKNRAADLAALREEFTNNPGFLRKLVAGLTGLPNEVWQTGRMDIGPEEALPYAAQFVAPGMMTAPKGGLGIFGGRIGAKRTGRELTSVGRDGKPRFEIDDSQSKLNMAYDALRPKGGEHPVPRLGDVFDHPDLYAAYPDLRDIRLTQHEAGGGSYNHGAGVIQLPGITEEGNLSVLLHELSHGVAAREGHDLGSNPSAHSMPFEKEVLLERAKLAYGGVQQKLDAIQDKAAKYLKKQGNPAGEMRETPYYEEYKQWLARKKQAGEVYNRVQQDYSPQAQYRRNAGEVEARNVQHRDNVRRTLGEKYVDKDPIKTEDVPRSKQTLGDLLIKAMGNRS